MANLHSLPFSSSQSTVNSRPTQLPFSPSSPSASSRFQLPPSPIKPHTFGPVLTRPHNRSESIVSRHSRRQRSGSNGAEMASTTHAGGILPSASFFHPSKPSAARPASNDSVSSMQDISDPLAMVPEHSFSSDVDDEKLNSQILTSAKFSRRQKQSREPLLPVGGPLRRSTLGSSAVTPTRPLFSHHPSSSNVTTPPSPSRMRSSLDRMFRRGVSVDSVTKSMSVLGHATTQNASPRGGSPVTEGRMTFEMVSSDHGHTSLTQSYPNRISSSPVFTNSAPMSYQHHSFIPTPPANSPDLSQVPMTDSQGRPVYNYMLHASRNRFFCGGRILTGGDSPWAFIASLAVVFGIVGVYFGTTCVWWWKNESPAVAAVGAYMTLLTISSMMATAFSDPGILPRDLDLDPPYPNSSPSDGASKTPLPRDLKVRAGVVRVKYCSTCRTYRPPRSSHCKMCDNCVDGCDHHCQWVNNCIGRRNYASFFVFLLSAVLTLILIIVTSALHLYLLTAKENMDFKHAINHGVGSAVAFSVSIIVIWPVTALLAYHLRLLVLNATTIEQIRNQVHKALGSTSVPQNPFSHGSWRHNLAYVLCRPMGYSWLDGAAVSTEDKRAINPGMEKYDDGEKPTA